jgi:hypothetical protein
MTGTTGDGADRRIPGHGRSTGCGDVDFAQAAGAYLLGALSDADEQSFREHLRACPACAAQVDELRPVVALLGTVTDQDLDAVVRTGAPVTTGFADLPVTAVPSAADVPVTASSPAGSGRYDSPRIEPPPDTLWPRLLVAANQNRRTHRRLVTALSAVAGLAAAAVIALAVVLATGSGSPAPLPAAGQELTLTPVDGAHVQATATLVGKKWGTEITLHCRYAGSSGGSGEQESYPAGRPPVYSLRVTDSGGAEHDLGSWSLPGNLDATFIGGTALPPGQIRSVQVLNANGTPVLTAAG